MREVAARAGVDISLVSRLLRDDPLVKASAATRARVFDAVKELDYRPNLAARALATARGLMVAFVLPELTNPVYAQIVAGAHRRAVTLGYEIVIGELGDGGTDQIKHYQSRGFDGVLLAAGTVDEQLIHEMRDTGVPMVVVNRTVPAVRDCAVVDYGAAIRLAAEHLVALGHTRVAALTGPADFAASGRRGSAFSAEMARLGHDATVAVAAGYTVADGVAAGRELLDGPPAERVTAAFATTPMLGVGLLTAARELGLAVPDDLSVASMHDFELADVTVPPLTTVAMPMEELGAAALDHLLAVVDGRDPGPTVVATPPVLIARASTGTPRASAGTPGGSTGTPRASTGTPRASTGTPGGSTGTPGGSTGTPR